MKFARTEMLYLVWLIPVLLLLIIYGMKRRRTILERFAHPKTRDALVPDTGTLRRKIKAALFLLATLFLLVALAGPQYGYRWEEVQQHGVDIVVALDCSRSMLATDISPTRLDRAKREIYDLLGLLQGDRVGLVAFAGTAFLQCPLTIDYQAFNLFLDSLAPDFLPVGGTDLSGAIRAALNAFDPNTASEKAVILITDGESTSADDPVTAAEQAASVGAKLFCIGVGSENGVPIPDGEGGFRKDGAGSIVVTRLDEDTLKKIALTTGGAYVRSVAGDMDLDVIYTKEILGGMERTALEGGRRQVWEDRYQWLLAVAVVLLFMDLMTPVTRKALMLCILLLGCVMGRPAFADAYRDGFAAYEKGDFETALKQFIDAQLDAPDDPEILYNLGNTYYRLGDFESAARHYAMAAKAGDKTLQEMAHYNLGNTAFRKKDYKTAIEQYEKALALDPDDQKAKENMAFVKQVMAQEPPPQEKPQPSGDESPPEEKQTEENLRQNAGKSDSSDENPSFEEKPDGEKPDGEKSEGESNADKEAQSQAGQQPASDEFSETQENSGASPEAAEPEDARAARSAEEASQPPEGEPKQADRILNRLQDRPGAALMPSYGKQRVERDW